MNLKQILKQSTDKYGEKTAIISGNRRLSYTKLDRGSNRIANYLTGLGVKKGDRLAILLTNDIEYPVLYFGIMKIGGIAVLLDVKYKMDELDTLFRHCQPKVLISESPYLEPLMPVLNRYNFIKHIIDVSGLSEGKFPTYQDIMTQCSAEEPAVEPSADDVAIIAYTSGPTFRPRGVILTHRNLVVEAKISADGFQQTDRDISTLFALPLHHVFGLVGILLTAIYCGSAVIVIPGLSLGGAMETIEEEKATMFMGVPYVYALMTTMARNEGISHNLSSVRVWGSSGAPLSEDIIKDFRKYFATNLINFWGLSEASCHITCPPLDGSGKPGSVGKAIPGWEIKIVDKDNKELPMNHDGEIVVRGIPVMQGYYNNPQETARTLIDGWLYTGDIGRIDENGYLFITGRKKNMIIRKGQNIYPSDVEDLIKTHPQIAEVAVVGVMDSLRGEELRAFVATKKDAAATEHEIRQFCLGHLASYKVPKHIIIAKSLPHTTAGEIDREELKKSTTSSLSI